MKKAAIFLAAIFCLFALSIFFFSTRGPGLPEYSESCQFRTDFCPRGFCETALQKLFEGAEESIKCAFFEFELGDTLNDVAQNVSVRFIFDDEYAPDDFMFEHKTDKSPYLMHNKFCVVDDELVLTGSYNPTERGTYFNNNNLLTISCPAIAQDFSDEFEEMWSGVFHGGEKKKGQGAANAGAFFCPEDGCEDALAAEIRKAQKTVYFMTFSFTSRRIAEELVDATKRGVSVQGIFEKSQAGEFSQYEYLRQNSIPVYLDNNPYNMHHKVFVIDNKTTVSGSYNPTNNGNRYNDENFVVVQDELVAAEFIREFNIVSAFSSSINPKREEAAGLLIYSVFPNPPGNDEGLEYFEIFNPTNQTIDLSHYYIYDNKTEKRLNGSIKPNQAMKLGILTLRNSNGILALKNASRELADFVSWSPPFTEEIKKGYGVVRTDFGYSNCIDCFRISEGNS